MLIAASEKLDILFLFIAKRVSSSIQPPFWN